MKNPLILTCFAFPIFMLSSTGLASQADYLVTQYQQTSNQTIEKNNPEITVGTYNIAGGLKGHVIDTQKLGASIKSLNTDIIGLQEVIVSKNKNELDEIARNAGMHYVFSKDSSLNDMDFGTAILSKYPIIKYKFYKLPDANEAETKHLLVAEIKHPDFKLPIFVFNIHPDWRYDDEVRTKQVSYINNFPGDNWTLTDEFPEIVTSIMILVGDFNDVDGSHALHQLDMYWNPMINSKITDDRTWPAANPMIGVDHIFTTKNQKWEVLKTYIPNKDSDWKSINWPLVSDHIPVVVRMKLQEY